MVQFKVCEKAVEQNQSSLYYFENRSHVISFDNLNAESHLLHKGSNPFQVKFLDTGVYYYRCQIYTRMRGQIEVVERKQFQQIPVVKSVRQIGQMLNSAATPAARGQTDFSKSFHYEQFFGEQRPPSPKVKSKDAI